MSARVFQAVPPRYSRIGKGNRHDIENAPSFLPKLCADITLERGNKMLIIDAKRYGRILTLRYGNEKLSANNRNQILSYVLHAEYENELDVSGMLPYAQTEKERCMRETWNELGHEFHCRTLNLNREFREIAAELDEIAALMYAQQADLKAGERKGTQANCRATMVRVGQH